MNKNKAMEILTNFICKLEKKNELQGEDFYKTALRILQNTNSSKDDLDNLYRNFCGYMAHGEFSDSEYQDIKRLIDCFNK
ncbi:hypothetical protein JHU04_004252 [Brenneria sp. 4F2]|nr:hypothetical protein [Brenneria bubanii]